MIDVYIHNGPGKSLESVDEAFRLVYDAPRETDTAVVRLDSDKEFFAFMQRINERAQSAAKGSQLIGGSTSAWVVQPGSVFVEAGGWRIIVNRAVFTTQQPMPQPNGMRRQ